MSQLPKISIVTPCFNMHRFVDTTIRSVCDQQYGNLEYIFVDGGSTDGTLKKVQKHSSRIHQIISEPDDGQYDAINKGFANATGDVFAWLNADDVYFPWTLSTVAAIFSRFPDVEWITGLPSFCDEGGQITSIHSEVPSYPRNFIANGWYRNGLAGYLQQESMFWRRGLWEKGGELSTSKKFAADFELWTQFAKHAELIPVNVPLASFRKRRGEQRSSKYREIYEQEVQQVISSLHSPPKLWVWLSGYGLVLQSLIRLLLFRTVRLVAFSESAGWVISKTILPVSRISIRRMYIEWRIRKNEP